MINESLNFHMIVYDETPQVIRDCLYAFHTSIKLHTEITMTVIDNYPGWEFGHSWIEEEYPEVRCVNRILNSSQARNWNFITRLTLLDGKKWCGIIAPDTLAKTGWLDVANQYFLEDYKLIGHLNFSVFHALTIKQLNWFDERHVSGGSEDLDMYLRFEEAGIPYSRESFAIRKLEMRGGGNQYRDTNEKVAQFRADCEYWLKKWRKDKSKMPSSDSIYFHPENRQRNWPEVDWYPKVLDRDAYE